MKSLAQKQSLRRREIQSPFMMYTYSFLLLIFHQNVTDSLLLLEKKKENKRDSSYRHSLAACIYVWLCVEFTEMLYHLAGRPCRKVLHHLIHLFKLLGHCLNLLVQLLVLSVLVIKHCLVPVLLFI